MANFYESLVIVNSFKHDAMEFDDFEFGDLHIIPKSYEYKERQKIQDALTKEISRLIKTGISNTNDKDLNDMKYFNLCLEYWNHCFLVKDNAACFLNTKPEPLTHNLDIKGYRWTPVARVKDICFDEMESIFKRALKEYTFKYQYDKKYCGVTESLEDYLANTKFTKEVDIIFENGHVHFCKDHNDEFINNINTVEQLNPDDILAAVRCTKCESSNSNSFI